MRGPLIFIVTFVLTISAVGSVPVARAADGCASEGPPCILPTDGSIGVCVRNEVGFACGLGVSVQTSGPLINNNQTKTQGPTINNTNRDVILINPLKGDGTLQSFLLNILDFVILIGSIIVILMLVFVGYKFVAAQGVPGKIEEARSMLLWTVVGALILLGAKVIAGGIQATVRALGS